MGAVVGIMTDEPSSPSLGYENLGNGMQVNSFTLIVKKKGGIFTHTRPRCQRSYRLLHSLSVISKYLFVYGRPSKPLLKMDRSYRNLGGGEWDRRVSIKV